MNFKKIIVILLILTLVITIHEFGHLFAARNQNLAVNDLNVGFAIPFLEKLSVNIKIEDINIRLNPILIGGYVIIPQENIRKLEFYKKNGSSPKRVGELMG